MTFKDFHVFCMEVNTGSRNEEWAGRPTERLRKTKRGISINIRGENKSELSSQKSKNYEMNKKRKKSLLSIKVLKILENSYIY